MADSFRFLACLIRTTEGEQTEGEPKKKKNQHSSQKADNFRTYWILNLVNRTYLYFDIPLSE